MSGPVTGPFIPSPVACVSGEPTPVNTAYPPAIGSASAPDSGWSCAWIWAESRAHPCIGRFQPPRKEKVGDEVSLLRVGHYWTV